MRPPRELELHEVQGSGAPRLSALLGLVHVPLMGGWLLIVWLGEWVDYAALLGMNPHHVSVYLSELIPTALFLPSLGTWIASSGLAIRLAVTRSVWYLWPVFLPFTYPVIAGVIAGILLLAK